MSKINIFFNIAENSGVGLYRQFLLAQTLKEKGLANVLINDFTWGQSRIFCSSFYPDCKFVVSGYDNQKMVAEMIEHLKTVHQRELTPEEQQGLYQKVYNMIEPSVEMLSKIGIWADIIVFGRRDTADYLSTWGGLRQFYNIPIVLDTDDNVHATRPFNPGYRGYYPGAESLHWNRRTAREVNALTVSTENLKHVHDKDNSSIFVIPNNLEFKRWAKAKKPAHEEIRMGLLVSSAHHEDVKLLEKALPILLKKYPNLHFYYTEIFNYLFTSFSEEFKAQMHPIGWIDLKTWPESVVGMGFDIGLAPLVDNFFNRAKSNLRFLEYSAAKMATVASPVEPYKCIQHKKTGFLARNTQDWVDYVSILVEKKKLRETMQQRAFDWVAENFDIEKNAKLYLNIYKQIINNYKTAFGKPKFPRTESFGVSAITSLPQILPK